MKPPVLYVDRFALAVWNHANLRAREEYRHHPNICGGENRYFANCEHCQALKETRA